MAEQKDPAAGIRNPAQDQKGGVNVAEAIEKAMKLMWQAHETLMDAVDGDSPEFDRVVSIANDIEDFIDSVKGV